MRSIEAWKDILRVALRKAIRARETQALAVIRETLAAIENAEAPDASVAPAAQPGVVAGGVPGAGKGDVPRLELSTEAVMAVIQREMNERRDAAASYAALGRHDKAGVLRLQLEVLEGLISQPDDETPPHSLPGG